MMIKHWFRNMDAAKGFAEGIKYANDSALTVLDIGAGGNNKHEAGWVITVEDEDATRSTPKWVEHYLID